MKTAGTPVGVLGGVCMSDLYADPAQHASLDVNGWFDGEYRGTRQGLRLIDNVFTSTASVPGAFDWRGVYAFKSLAGAPRLLAVANVRRAVTITVKGAAVSGVAGNVVLLVYDALDGTILAAASFGDSEDHALVLGIADWSAQFYEQRDTLIIAGHPTGTYRVRLNALRQEVIRDTLGTTSPILLTYTFSCMAIQWTPGQFTSIYPYYTGEVPQCCIFPVGSQAWYTFTREKWVGVSSLVDPVQELLPANRVSADRLSVRLDNRMAVWSESEAPECVRAMYSSFLAPANTHITAVGTANQTVAILFDQGSMSVDLATLGQQAVRTNVNGTTAPLSVESVENSIVFVNHAGIVRMTDEGEKVESSPFLDPLFKGTARSTLPQPLSATQARLGVPWTVDHTRLDKAVGLYDNARGWYLCAVTTTGSLVENDLLIIWDVRRGRFFLHHGQQAIQYGDAWTNYRNEYVAAPYKWEEYFIIPGFSIRSMSAVQRPDGGNAIYICNETGVYELWANATVAPALSTTPCPVLERDWYYWRKGRDWYYSGNYCAIESVRVSPALMLSNHDVKRTMGVRCALWSNVHKDNGVAAIYVEGERGSTQLINSADLARTVPYPETGSEGVVSVVRAERDRPFWGDGVHSWGDGSVLARPDYVDLDAALGAPPARWMRVTLYDQRFDDAIQPVLNALTMEVEAGIVRPADESA